MPALATLVIVMTILVISSIRQPSLAFALLFLMVGIDQLAQIAHPVFAKNSALVNLFVAAFVGYGVMYRVARGQIRALTVSTTWALVIALYGYTWVTLVWVPAHYIVAHDPAFASNRFVAYLPYFVLYLVLAPMLPRQVSDLREPFQLLLIMNLVLLVGLIIFGGFQEGERGIVGVTGVEMSALPLASFSGVAIFAAVFIQSARYERLTLLIRPAVIVLALIAIVGSGTRGQLLFALLVVALVWPLSQGGRFTSRYVKGFFILLVLLLAVLIAFELAGDLWQDRWTVGSGEGAGTIYGRFLAQIEMMGSALPVWQSSPATIIFGVGNTGSFSLLPFEFYIHNVPLEVLMEEGVLGFLLYSSALILAYRSFRGLLVRFRGDPRAIGDICFLFSVGLFYFLGSLKEGSFVSAAYLSLFPAVILANLDRAESKAAIAHAAQGAPAARAGAQAGSIAPRQSLSGG